MLPSADASLRIHGLLAYLRLTEHQIERVADGGASGVVTQTQWEKRVEARAPHLHFTV
ncbi:MAG: hypothetical protein H7274_15605 [Rhodoferax sp.]|nr:hypothetical protein [Rhodoferax sp.]